MNRASFSRLASSLEALETRIAPAAIIFNYTDADGNAVTITSSKGTLADLQAALSPTPIDAATPTQILTLNLGTVFKGADISVVAAGDAVTKIGFINAEGVDLGRVNIDGELNRIVAGDGNSRTVGLRGLTLTTFGKFDVTPATTTDTEFDSEIIGALTALSVAGDMQGASLKVFGSDFETATEPTTFRDGKIGSVFIGGSLTGTARNFGGSIITSGDIGNVIINGDLKGLALAGMAVTGQDKNAHISAGLALGSVTVVGNIQGGDGLESGQITSGLGIRSLSAKNVLGGEGKDSGVVGSGGSLGKINIVESIVGGGGMGSGAVTSFSNMLAVTVGGSVQGGNGENSGWIAAGGTLASVNIGLDLAGGDGAQSGQVGARGKISSVTIGRDLVGGTNFETGAIGSFLGLGPVLIKGDILAGSGERSALITTQKASYGEGEEFIAAPITSVTVLGSIDCGDNNEERAVGGPAGNNSGGILASGNLGTVLIKGDVFGGDGNSSGHIAATGNIKSVTIEGTLGGGGGAFSGSIRAGGTLGPVSIGVNLEGNDGYSSGTIFSATKIAKVTIKGNVFGGDGSFSGAIETGFESSSDVVAITNESSNGADMGAIFVGGSLVGGDNVFSSGSGRIFSTGKIASVTIGDPNAGSENENQNGSVIGRFADGSGSISSRGDLGPVKIKFDLRGGTGHNSGRIFSEGKISSLAVGVGTGGSIIGGNGTQDSSFGYGPEFGQVFAIESIAKVEIGGRLEGGSGNFTAQVRASSIGTVKVGAIEGGEGEGSGSIVAYSSGITSVKIVGFDPFEISAGFVAGRGPRSGWIAAEGSIGSVEAGFVEGVVGSTRARISAVDKVSSVTIGDTIFLADIFAGYNTEGVPINSDAQIGTVRINGSPGSKDTTFGGNISGVNIVAGAITGQGGSNGQGDGLFGTFDDEPIGGFLDTPKYSKIASVIIGGTVLPASVGQGIPTHFGIIAQNIGSIVVGGTALKLKAGAGNDGLLATNLVGAATDTTYGEVTTSVIVGGLFEP